MREMSMSNSLGHGLIRQAVRRSSVIDVQSRTHPGVCGSYGVPPGHKADLASQQKRRPPLLCTRFLENSLTATKTKVLQGKHRAMTMVPRAVLATDSAQELVLEIKGKLEREHSDLPVGKNGRDDEDMILWFLKDRKFSVDDAVGKLTKAIKWRQDFGVSGLSEESVKSLYGTGKAYVHDLLDINGRPVLVVVASKHFPAKQDMGENEKLCVFLIEKALSKLPPGTEEILGIFDLRGFSTANGDILFFKFLMDVFYYYYPRRLGQVLFVDAPFVFQPIWQLVKPLMKSYASLVKFCNAETVRKEYFTEATVPADFKN